MVPKVAGKGRSFQGAALYYLHDKGALTAQRVAFTLTENLPTDDPDKAIKCMAWTAMHQNDIKARAGGSPKGRKLEFPVYTYSLSWAPDENPDREEMLAAARESLKALGLEGHETLFVSHNDEPQPHIHVIVNRVHPETGIAAKLGNDHLKLSRWAEAYERRQGKIRCEQRVENNARRREGEFVKDIQNQKAAEFYRWRRLRRGEIAERREQDQSNLSMAHRIQRKFLYEQKERQIRAKAAALREDNKIRWHNVYTDQQDQRDKLLLQHGIAWSQLRDVLKDRPRAYFHAEREQRTGFLSAGFNVAAAGPRQLAALEKEQRAFRARVARAIQKQRRDAFNDINAAYRADLQKLKDQQRAQKDALDKAQSEDSQRRARAIKQGLDRQEFERERRARPTTRHEGRRTQAHRAPKQTAQGLRHGQRRPAAKRPFRRRSPARAPCTQVQSANGAAAGRAARKGRRAPEKENGGTPARPRARQAERARPGP